MVAAFKRIAVAARMPKGVRITGHSPRVTGAQRMARAGLSEWRIQVFGRWGSVAIRRYTRESVIEGAASGIAKDVEEAQARVKSSCFGEVVKECAGEVARAGGGVAADTLVETAVEELAGRPEFADPDVSADVVRQQALCTLWKVQDQLEGEPRKAPPFAVRNARSGLLHVVKDERRTWCTWKWAASDQVRPASAEAVGVWCLVCATRAVRFNQGV